MQQQQPDFSYLDRMLPPPPPLEQFQQQQRMEKKNQLPPMALRDLAITDAASSSSRQDSDGSAVQSRRSSAGANSVASASSPPSMRPTQLSTQSLPLQQSATQPPQYQLGFSSQPQSVKSPVSMADNANNAATPPSAANTSGTATVASVMPYEATLELYRQNAKKSNDPQIQMEFARYLIQLAESIQQQPQMDRQARKARNALMTEGVKWIKRLASTGLGVGKAAFPEAQFYLAECYGNGLLGLPIDHDKAFSLYVQASKQNLPAATYRAGVCYEIGAGPKRDYARAVQFYRKAAALGDTGAMYKVAMVLLTGSMNTPKNEREGVTWLKRSAAAADEAHPEPLYELASVYEKGGVPSVIADEAYARELYTKAAQLGHAKAQFKLGFCYEYGNLTCEVDARRSIAWYTRAAEQGHAEAELALSGWYLTGSEGILQQSDTEAYLWARKSAEQAFAKAEYAVGYYSEVGIGVQATIEEAIRWYTKAAAQGNQRAKQRLAEIKKYNKMQGKIGADKLRSENSDCTIS